MSERNLTRYIPEFITNNFERKFVALLFALIVYYKISLGIGFEESFDGMKLNVETGDNTVLIESSVATLKVTVKSFSKRSLNTISASDFKARIKIPEGYYNPRKPVRVHLETKDITTPSPDIIVMNIVPSFVMLKLDNKFSKELPVEVKFTGSLSEYYACGAIDVEPRNVKVTGPRSVVELMRSIQAEPILLTRHTVESFEYESGLRIPDKIYADQATVKISVEIVQKNDQRKFSGLPLEILKPVSGNLDVKRIVPTNVDVIVFGQKNLIELMSASQLKPFADITKIDKPGSYKVAPVCFSQNPKIVVIQINPDLIEIEVSEK